jgi:PIN domain nuclease of toxin-antitoxin system
VMGRYVLDASALLALLKAEKGSDRVIKAITEGAAISAVNLSEAVAKLNDGGMPEKAIHEALDALELDIVDFDAKQAYRAGLLRPLTRHAGLSLGDRTCLALAQQLNLPTLTTDRAWQDVLPNVMVQVIR